MSKRMFEILDEMNQDDAKNGTRLVEVANAFISADKVKQGYKVSMGIPDESFLGLAQEKMIPILILVDSDEYFKRKGKVE